MLRDRIDAFEPRFADLSQEESERLDDLLSLHNTIRDAPATFSATHTAARAATRLIVPTIVFIITVFGEVSAEGFWTPSFPEPEEAEPMASIGDWSLVRLLRSYASRLEIGSSSSGRNESGERILE